MDKKELEKIIERAPKTLRLGDLEGQVAALALDNKGFFLKLQGFLQPSHFDIPDYSNLWGWMTSFYHSNKSLPTRRIIEHACGQNDWHFSIPEVNERESTYVGKEVFRIVRRQQLEKLLVRLIMLAQEEDPDLDDAFAEFSIIKNLQFDSLKEWLNYFDVDSRYARLQHFWDARLSTGFPTLDSLLPGGGLGQKEMVAVMGAPGSGKCTDFHTPVEIEFELTLLLNNENTSPNKIEVGGAINASSRTVQKSYKRHKEQLAKNNANSVPDLQFFRKTRERLGNRRSNKTFDEETPNRRSKICSQQLLFREDESNNSSIMPMRVWPDGQICFDNAQTICTIRNDSPRLSQLSVDNIIDRTQRMDFTGHDSIRGRSKDQDVKKSYKPNTYKTTNEQSEQSALELPVPRILDRSRIQQRRSISKDQRKEPEIVAVCGGENSWEEEAGDTGIEEPIITGVYCCSKQMHNRGSEKINAMLQQDGIKTSNVREESFRGNQAQNICSARKNDRQIENGVQGLFPLSKRIEDVVRGFIRDRISPVVRTKFIECPEIQQAGDQILRSPYGEKSSLFSRLLDRQFTHRNQRPRHRNRQGKGGSSVNAVRRAVSILDRKRSSTIIGILPSENTNSETTFPRENRDQSKCSTTKIIVRMTCPVGYVVGLKKAFSHLAIKVKSETGYKLIEHAWLTQPNPEWYIETENGASIYCADDHRVQTKNNFQHVQKITVEEEILTIDGWSKIIVVNPTGRTIPMVDLQVEGKHYYTNGILSHNTTWLINIAARIMMRGHQVLHLTREVSEDIVGLRYDCSLLNSTANELLGDRPVTIDRLKKIRHDFGFESQSPLWIKEYPTGTSTISQAKADYQILKEQENVKAALCVDDYPDLARPEKQLDKEYSNVGLVFAESRGWMVEEEMAGLVATQATRDAEDLRDDAMIQMKHSSDSYHKPRLLDVLITINEGAEDKISGHQRLYFAKNRNEKTGVWGKFKVDKARMRIIDIRQSSFDAIGPAH